MRTVKSDEPEVTPMAAISITPANVLPSKDAKFLDAQAYETILQGQAIAYLEPPSDTASVPFVRLADAGVYYRVIGVAATGASAIQPVKVILKDPALGLGGTIAPGDVAYVGVTPGSITVTYADLTSGKFVSVLGVGVGNNKLNLDPVRADIAK
jgi:hypothetical protein